MDQAGSHYLNVSAKKPIATNNSYILSCSMLLTKLICQIALPISALHTFLFISVFYMSNFQQDKY